MRVGVIGAGTWGKNHVRVWSELPQAELVAVADTNPEVGKRFAMQYRIRAETDYHKLLDDPQIEAVSICTPSSTHYAIVKEAIVAGKHVLVEKPIAFTAAQGKELAALADERHVILMVGHVFRFDPLILRVKQEIEKGTIGKINFLYSSRLGLMTPKPDCGVIMDFALHDIDIACFLTGELPKAVTAVAQSFHETHGRSFEDVGFLTLHFPSGILAHATVSWLTPKKVRDLWVIGSRKSIGADMISQQCDIFDKGVVPEYNTFGEFKLITRQSDDLRIAVESREPLKEELAHFAECVRMGKQPVVPGLLGAQIVQIIEACYRSLREQRTVSVEYG